MSVLVGKKAPDFAATAVLGNNEIKEIKLSEFTKGKYVVALLLPARLHVRLPDRAHRLRPPPRGVQEARRRRCIGVSIDSQFTHLAWKNTPVDKGGIGQVKYPLVADVKHEIARPTTSRSSGGVAFRGSFLIDKNGVVRHQVVNDLPLGRNVDEMLRMVDALQFTEEHGEVCPAGWNKGKKGMKADAEGRRRLPRGQREGALRAEVTNVRWGRAARVRVAHLIRERVPSKP